MEADRGLDCVEVVELVTDYLEGDLDSATSAAVEAHLAGCPGCLEYVAQIRQSAATLGRLSTDGISEQVRKTLVEAFRAWAGERRPSGEKSPGA